MPASGLKASVHGDSFVSGSVASESDDGPGGSDDAVVFSPELGSVIGAAVYLASTSRRRLDSYLLLLALLEQPGENSELAELFGYLGLPRHTLRSAVERMTGRLPSLPAPPNYTQLRVRVHYTGLPEVPQWTTPATPFEPSRLRPSLRRDDDAGPFQFHFYVETGSTTWRRIGDESEMPEIPRDVDDESLTLLLQAAEIAGACGRPDGAPLPRDLLAAILERPGSAAHDLLGSLLSLHLAGLDELAAGFRHFLAADPDDTHPFLAWLQGFLPAGAAARADLPVERAGDDKLGFQGYVNSLALLAASTPPPMAVGIYGPWGSGKSSILKLVQARLREGYQVGEAPGSRRRGQRVALRHRPSWLSAVMGPFVEILLSFSIRPVLRLLDPARVGANRHLITIWFNAWEHKDAGTLWAHLLEQIYGEMEARVKKRPLYYWRFIISQRAGRFLRDRLISLPGLALSLLPVLAALFAEYVLQSNPVVFGLSTAAVLSALGIRAALDKPVTQTLKDSLHREAKQATGGLMEEVGANLDFLYRSITGRDLSRERLDDTGLKPGREDVRIVVFIDDLDRCPPDRVVEVLEAIKLILEKPFIVVFVAMDVRMLVRAVEQRYEGALPQTIHPGGPGMEYLEKIIQIPFWVPRAQMEAYAESLLAPRVRPEVAGAGPTPRRRELPWSRIRRVWQRRPFRRSQPASDEAAVAPQTAVAPAEPDPAQVPAAPRDYLGSVKLFNPPPIPTSDEEMALIRDYAAYFATSPRGVKRVVNLFRLAKGLTWSSGQALDSPEAKRKVIRLIVLGERFPDFWQFAYEHVFSSETAETVDGLYEAFVASEQRKLDSLPGHLASARRAELVLLGHMLRSAPALSLADMRELSPSVVNLPPISSWDSLAAVRELEAAAGHVAHLGPASRPG